MRITRNQLLSGALLAGAAGVLSAGTVLLLTGNPGGSPDSLSVAPLTTATPSAEPSPLATVAPTLTPTPSPTSTPKVSPSATATKALALATAPATLRPTASPTPKATTAAHPKQTLRVALSGPRSAVVGEPTSYTMVVHWDHERPAFLKFSFDNSLPSNNGCTRPTSPPAGDGPGSTTLTMSATFRDAGDQQVGALASMLCQYYEGSTTDSFVVHVTAASPSPTPTPTY